MRSAIQVALSLVLVLFTSCQSPAQEDSPTTIDPTAKAVAPEDGAAPPEAEFAGEDGLRSERGLAGGVVGRGPVDRSADDSSVAAPTTTPDQAAPTTSAAPAHTMAETDQRAETEDPLSTHAVGRAETADTAQAQQQATREADPRDQKIFELTERVAALQTELEELKMQLRQLEDLERQVANLQGAVDNLAATGEGGDAGRRALGAMSESPQLRGEIAEKLQGKVRLVNNTGREQVLYINGTPWTVVEGRSYVYAPVGKVSFQMLGQSEPMIKGVQEWQANPTTNEMELVLDLSASYGQSVVTRRPVTLDQQAAGTQQP